MSLKVTVVTLEGISWEGKADEVVAPATTGAIGILPGRQPFLAGLSDGTVRVKVGNEEVFSEKVKDGLISVDSDDVTIVIDTITPSVSS